MTIKVEPKRGGRSHQYTHVQDITIQKHDGITYVVIKFKRDPDVYIPAGDFRIYEQGWTQLEIELDNVVTT